MKGELHLIVQCYEVGSTIGVREYDDGIETKTMFS